MKTKLFTLLVALLATTNLWAKFLYDNLYYETLSSNTVEVVGSLGEPTSVTIPTVVQYDDKQYTVSRIGDGAFKESLSHSSLTSITIPNSVTSIGAWAFYGCKLLSAVTLPNNLTSIGSNAFSNCKSLTSIVIPEGVTSIGDDAFSSCSSLTSVTIPNSVTSIESDAFSWCSSLTSVTIPNSVTSIGNYAFSHCSSLTSVTIPNSVTSIGEKAFYYCTFVKENFINNSLLNAEESDYWGAEIADIELDGLFIRNDTIIDCRPYVTSISIPSNITSIGAYAFSDCTSLTSITIPNSVTSIGTYAFDWCTSLTSVTIPNSVTSIGTYAFYNCSSLTSVTIPNSMTSIENSAFRSCSSLTSVTIPNSVTSIGTWAFCDCSSLTSIVIPDGVTSIGVFAFENSGIYNEKSNWENNALYINDCLILIDWNYTASTYCIKEGTRLLANGCCDFRPNLESITIPNSVRYIGQGAFADCGNLATVTIGGNVKYIGPNAFSGTYFYNNEANWMNNVLYLNNYLLKGRKGLIGDYSVKQGTTLIAAQAFSCDSLVSISLPNSVAYLGEKLFTRSSSWKTMVCEALDVPEVSELTFNSSISEVTLYVPACALKDYITADHWKDFGKILPIESGLESIKEIKPKDAHKVLQDGQVVILHNEKVYNILGQKMQNINQ